MTSETKIIGVADGGIGLSEELKRQFPTMQFILDKSHLKDHLYKTAEAIGISSKDRPSWVTKRVRVISDGNVETVLKELEEINNQMLNDKDYLYSSIVKDNYFLGVVLAKKYRFLRIAYNIFMYGLVLIVLAFIVALAVPGAGDFYKPG